MARLVTAVTSTLAFWASCVLARFSSSAVMAKKRFAGTPGALFMAMSELVLHGFPTTSTRTSLAAFLAIALPWPVKILPLMPSKSLRSMPALRGTAPTSSAQFTPLNAASRLDVATMPLSSGNAQSSSSMQTPFKAAMAFSSGISRRWRMTGCSGPNAAPEAMRNRRE